MPADENRGIDITELIPGGIKGSDHLHRGTYYETCSRCRLEFAEDDIPLLCRVHDGRDLYAFCRDCNGLESIDPPDEYDDFQDAPAPEE